MWVERARMGARLSIAGAGAVAVWAFLLNRVVIQWVDGPLKIGTMIALGAGLAALGWFSARTTLAGSRGLALWAWPAILGSFGVGEVHRAWLRSTYGATSMDAPLWDPVTTTDLELRRFTLEVAPLGAERVRIVALSDLHVTDGTDPAFIERVHASI